MIRGHNNIVYGGICNFLYKNGFYKNICNGIGVCVNQKYQNMSMGMTYRTNIALQLQYFYSFLIKQYIRGNPDV